MICVGLESDPVLVRLQQMLEASGVSVIRLDPTGFAAGNPMLWDGEGFMSFAEDITAVDGIVVRRLPASQTLPEDGVSMAAEEIERAGTAALERMQFFEAWLYDAEARGVPVYNPFRSRIFESKPIQLAAFQHAGVPIPRTLISNSATAVRAFAQDVREVIFKPVAGGRETELLSEEKAARLHLISSAPVIFQERVVGPDIRVTVVGGEVVSQVEIPSHPIDYRLGEAYRAGEQHYLKLELPSEVQAMALKVSAICQYSISGIDFKRTADGQYIVLEANSAPMYLDIELKTHHPISQRFVELIKSKKLTFN